MTNVEAIKTYFSSTAITGVGIPVTNQELMALKKGTTPQEWDAMGAACAKALDQSIDAK